MASETFGAISGDRQEECIGATKGRVLRLHKERLSPFIARELEPMSDDETRWGLIGILIVSPIVQNPHIVGDQTVSTLQGVTVGGRVAAANPIQFVKAAIRRHRHLDARVLMPELHVWALVSDAQLSTLQLEEAILVHIGLSSEIGVPPMKIEIMKKCLNHLWMLSTHNVH